MAGGLDNTNSKAFMDRTIQAVQDIDARQKDQKQKVRVHGRVVVNPQLFKFSTDTTLLQEITNMPAQAAHQYLLNRGHDKRHFTLGPIKFTTVFKKQPTVTFGQATPPASGDFSPPGQADDFVPFLVIPYVYTWHHADAAVDGFYLGLYALTAPIAGAGQHFVYWAAEGSASRYNNHGQNEAWSQHYDLNRSQFLETS